MLLLACLMIGAARSENGSVKPIAILAEPNSELITFSRDGKVLATRGGLWHVASRRCLYALGRDDTIGWTLIFSPDGQTLAVWCPFPVGGGFISLRDPATGKRRGRISIDRSGPTDPPWIAYAPDGKTIAVLWRGVIAMYDTVTLKERVGSNGDGRSYMSLAYAPDGRALAAASADSDVRLLDPATLRTLAAKADGRYSGSLTCAPDGRALAAACADGNVRILDPATLLTLASLPTPQVGISRLTYSTSGKTLVAKGTDGSLWLCDLPDGRPRQVWNPRDALNRHGPAEAPVFTPDGKPAPRGHAVAARSWCADLAPDGQTLAITGTGWSNGTAYGAVYVVDASTGRQVAVLEADESSVASLSFSPDGKTLATGSGTDRNVKLWDMEQVLHPSPRPATGTPPNDDHAMKPLAILAEPNSELVAFSPDGKTLATRDAGLWDLAGRRRLHSELKGSSPSYSVVFSPDGKTLALKLGKCCVSLRDAATGEERDVILTNAFGSHLGNPTIAYAPDGKTLAVLRGFIVEIYDTTSLKLRIASQKDGSVFSALAYAPDGRSLALGCYGTDGPGGIRLLDPGTMRLIAALPMLPKVGISSLAYSPNGKALVACGSNGSRWLWDLAAGQPREVWNVRAAPKNSEGPHQGLAADSLVFAPDGQTLAAASSWERSAYILDATTGTQLAVLRADSRSVTSLFFSPDGKILATGGATDGNIKLWDIEQLLQPSRPK